MVDTFTFTYEERVLFVEWEKKMEFSFLRGLAVAYTPLGPSKSIAHYKNRPSFRNEQIHEICLVLLILQTHPLHGCSGCCRHSTTAHMWNESFEMIKSNHGNTEILKTHTAMCDAAHVPQTVGQCRSCMQQCARNFIVVAAAAVPTPPPPPPTVTHGKVFISTLYRVVPFAFYSLPFCVLSCTQTHMEARARQTHSIREIAQKIPCQLMINDCGTCFWWERKKDNHCLLVSHVVTAAADEFCDLTLRLFSLQYNACMCQQWCNQNTKKSVASSFRKEI